MKKTLFLSAILATALCSSAFAKTVNVTTNNQNLQTLAGAGDTININLTGTNNYLSGNSNGITYNILADVNITSAELTNGYSNTQYHFKGALTGSGTLSFTGRNPSQGYVSNDVFAFHNDASAFSGTLSINGSNKLQFINDTEGLETLVVGASSVVSTGSADDAFKTSGNVLFRGAATETEGVYSGTVSAAHTTIGSGTTTIGSGVTASLGSLTLSEDAKLNVASGAAVTLGTSANILIAETKKTEGNGYGTIAINQQLGTIEGTLNTESVTWKVNGTTSSDLRFDSATNTLIGDTRTTTNYYINDATTYSSNADFANANKVIINNTVTVTQADGESGGFFHHEVLINGGGTLIMQGKDLMGWSGTNVKTLTLEDGATIKLERTNDSEVTRYNNETFNGSLVMKGVSSITGQITGTENAGGAWDIHTNSSITVEAGATATISTARLRTRRDNASISVGNNATLLVTADITKNGGNGVINKSGNGTLTITGTIANDITLNNNAGTTLVKDITLTGGAFKGVTFQNTMVNGTITLNEYTGDGKLQTALNNLTKSTAQGASSTINLGGGEYTFNAETTVNAHQLVFSGNTEINGHGYDSDGHTITLSNGASVNTGANELKIESKATLKLTNGTVTSGSVILGHNVVTNTNLTKNVGTLTMAGGSITTGFIKSNAGYAASDNTFTMAGGTLTFTKPASETVMVDGPEQDEEGNPIPVEQTNTYNAIDGVTATITGGTLSTAQAAWKIDNANASIGGVTISGANAAELANINLTNTITAQTGVSFSGTIHYTGAVSTRDKARTEGNGFGTLEQYATIATGNGAITNSATWLVGEQEMAYANKEITFDTGDASDTYYVNTADSALDITGANTLLVKQNATLATGTYALDNHAEVTNGAALTVSADTTLQAGTYLEVRENAVLTIGGTVTATNGAANYGLWMHNGAKVTIEGEGTLTVQGTTFKSADGETTITAKGDTQIGGTLSAPANTTITNAAMTITSGTFRAYNVVGGSLTVNSGTATNIQSALSATTDLAVTGAGTSAMFGQGSITVKSLTLNNGADITVETERDAHNGTLNVTELTVAADGSDVNANLVVNSGGTMTFASGAVLTMGCSVTIGDTVEVHISGADAEAIRHGSELTIINLGQLAATDVITLGSASIFIDNVEQNDFSLMRVDDADGTSRIVVAPEPATATLSLLALAALAARRKRH